MRRGGFVVGVKHADLLVAWTIHDEERPVGGMIALVDDHIDVDIVWTGRQTGTPASMEGAGGAEVEVGCGVERRTATRVAIAGAQR